jgi:hypothetical protein
MAEAPIIELDRYRDRHLVANAYRREPWPFGWHMLAWNNVDDRRNSLRRCARLGLHPIVLHGLNEDGSCTCGRCESDSRSRGKHPVESAWERAPFDLDRADRLCLQNWRFNLGLRMGLQPGGFRLLAIDLDGPREMLTPLEAQLGALPPTLTARTGRGGTHLIYRVDPDRKFRNRVRVDGHDFDLRCDGGQIVIAPSRHYSGGRYTWLDAREPAAL